MLEFSYLLDFVDGEVARLTGRCSSLGSFLDLIGHGLIKTSLPLAIGASAALETTNYSYLVAGAIMAVAITVGDSARLYEVIASKSAAAGELTEHNHERTPSGFIRWCASVFNLSFESPGLFGLVLLGAAADRIDLVALYGAIFAPLWLLMRLFRNIRRISQSDRAERT